MKPKIETASRATPGGYTPTEPNDPPVELVELLAAWLGRSEGYTLRVLAETRFLHRA